MSNNHVQIFIGLRYFSDSTCMVYIMGLILLLAAPQLYCRLCQFSHFHLNRLYTFRRPCLFCHFMPELCILSVLTFHSLIDCQTCSQGRENSLLMCWVWWCLGFLFFCRDLEDLLEIQDLMESKDLKYIQFNPCLWFLVSRINVRVLFYCRIIYVTLCPIIKGRPWCWRWTGSYWRTRSKGQEVLNFCFYKYQP